MKKLLSILMLVMASFILVSCSSGSATNTMDGEYYSYYSDSFLDDYASVVVEGNVLTYYWEEDDKYVFSIDKEKQTLTGGVDGRTVAYTFVDGKLSFAFLDSVHDYYLKDSPAYKSLLEQKTE